MKSKQRRGGNTREMVAVGLLFLAVALFLSLISYNPLDPSFNQRTTAGAVTENFLGLVGSHIADLLIQILGVASFLLPLFLLFMSAGYLMGNSFSISAGLMVGFVGLHLGSAAVLDKVFGTVIFYDKPIRAGGLSGEAVHQLILAYLNETGAVIIFAFLILLSLMLLFGFSFVKTILFLVVTADKIVAWVYNVVRRFFSGRRKKSPADHDMVFHVGETMAGAGGKTGKTQARSPRTTDSPQGSHPAVLKFQLPALDLLDDTVKKDTRAKKENFSANSRLLERKLADFGVEGKVVEVKPGPVITMYELEPAAGVKINRIANLADDMALAMKASSVRIIAPIPGKAAVGLEIPNVEREHVRLKEVLHNDSLYKQNFRLPIALGVDIVGTPVIADLAKMPHLLIAGTTGSGKSVALNAMICSILFKSAPDEVKLLMIDPKRLELSSYEGIPHLLHPVVVDPKLASQALKWAAGEMERRYKLISEVGAKGIDQYNSVALQSRSNALKGKIYPDREPQEGPDTSGGKEDSFQSVESMTPAGKEQREKLPYIVIVIDELADLMMVAQRNVEESLARLAQMSRAAGIHLILATQRPSVDVITGVIKANFPTRISFQVSSKVDSRTILDQHGAEKLLGAGDMLFLPPGTSRLVRIHGVYVSDREIEGIVQFIKRQGKPDYDETIVAFEKEARAEEEKTEDYDEKYDEAVELVTELGHASISLVQRYMKIGYNRAARIIERMEVEGVVGPSDGVKPRKVLARKIPR